MWVRGLGLFAVPSEPVQPVIRRSYSIVSTARRWDETKHHDSGTVPTVVMAHVLSFCNLCRHWISGSEKSSERSKTNNKRHYMCIVVDGRLIFDRTEMIPHHDDGAKVVFWGGGVSWTVFFPCESLPDVVPSALRK
jgi:hypothetical protein